MNELDKKILAVILMIVWLCCAVSFPSATGWVASVIGGGTVGWYLSGMFLGDYRDNIKDSIIESQETIIRIQDEMIAELRLDAGVEK